MSEPRGLQTKNNVGQNGFFSSFTSDVDVVAKSLGSEEVIYPTLVRTHHSLISNTLHTTYYTLQHTTTHYNTLLHSTTLYYTLHSTHQTLDYTRHILHTTYYTLHLTLDALDSIHSTHSTHKPTKQIATTIGSSVGSIHTSRFVHRQEYHQLCVCSAGRRFSFSPSVIDIIEDSISILILICLLVTNT